MSCIETCAWIYFKHFSPWLYPLQVSRTSQQVFGYRIWVCRDYLNHLLRLYVIISLSLLADTLLLKPGVELLPKWKNIYQVPFCFSSSVMDSMVAFLINDNDSVLSCPDSWIFGFSTKVTLLFSESTQMTWPPLQPQYTLLSAVQQQLTGWHLSCCSPTVETEEKELDWINRKVLFSFLLNTK